MGVEEISYSIALTIPAKGVIDRNHVLTGDYELEVGTVREPATVHLRPLYDPNIGRVKGADPDRLPDAGAARSAGRSRHRGRRYPYLTFAARCIRDNEPVMGHQVGKGRIRLGLAHDHVLGPQFR